MTTQTAFRLAQTDCSQADWDELEKTLLRAGYCPQCAHEGERVHLCREEPATSETYAGRACPQCEEFFVTPGQRGTEACREDYGGAFDGFSVMSDADPGL